MFGSDRPACALAAPYGEFLAHLRAEVGRWPSAGANGGIPPPGHADGKEVPDWEQQPD